MTRRNVCSQKGFMLVDTLVGLGIMGVFVVTLLGALSAGLLGVMAAQDAGVAESITRSQLEYIKGQPYQAGGGYASIAVPTNYSVAVGTATVPGTDINSIQEVTVTVYRGSKVVRETRNFKVSR